MKRSRETFTVNEILDAVCREMSVKMPEILSEFRGKRVVLGREVMAATLYRHGRALSWPDIARIMGTRHHSTVYDQAHRAKSPDLKKVLVLLRDCRANEPKERDRLIAQLGAAAYEMIMDPTNQGARNRYLDAIDNTLIQIARARRRRDERGAEQRPPDDGQLTLTVEIVETTEKVPDPLSSTNGDW